MRKARTQRQRSMLPLPHPKAPHLEDFNEAMEEDDFFHDLRVEGQHGGAPAAPEGPPAPPPDPPAPNKDDNDVEMEEEVWGDSSEEDEVVDGDGDSDEPSDSDGYTEGDETSDGLDSEEDESADGDEDGESEESPDEGDESEDEDDDESDGPEPVTKQARRIATGRVAPSHVKHVGEGFLTGLRKEAVKAHVVISGLGSKAIWCENVCCFKAVKCGGGGLRAGEHHTVWPRGRTPCGKCQDQL